MRLVISVLAQRDIDEAVAFIAADNPAAAERTYERILVAANRLSIFPQAGVLESPGRRSLQVPGTPYRIVYRLRGDAVVVVRIWHGARQWMH